MTFKIIHHFVSEEGVLREVKLLNVDKDIPKEEKFQWQWNPFGYDPIQLQYKSGVGNTRRFEEGVLTFDNIGAVFTYYAKTYRLNRSK